MSSSCAEFDLATLYPAANNIVLDDSTPELGNPFAAGPAGELYLSNASADQSFTSACVDAGNTSEPDEQFPAWRQSTTRTDGVLDGSDDIDPVDIGYHYGLFTRSLRPTAPDAAAIRARSPVAYLRAVGFL